MRCKNCGTNFKAEDLVKAQDKMLTKAIKDTFYYSGDILMRHTKQGPKAVVDKCGQITLPGGRRVQAGWVSSVLNTGKLPKKEKNE
jgi:hypothetical protein